MLTKRDARVTSVWARGQLGVPASTWYRDARPGSVQSSRRAAAVLPRLLGTLIGVRHSSSHLSKGALCRLDDRPPPRATRHRRTANWTGPRRGLTTNCRAPAW